MGNVRISGATATERVAFHCRRCGHRALADVTGTGEGTESFLNSSGTAQRRAERDAERDIVRTLRRARCPRCRHRNPGAFLRFLRPYLTMTAIFMALAIAAGFAPTWFDVNMRPEDKEIAKWVMPALIGFSLLLVVPLQVFLKWGTTDARVRWVDEAPRARRAE